MIDVVSCYTITPLNVILLQLDTTKKHKKIFNQVIMVTCRVFDAGIICEFSKFSCLKCTYSAFTKMYI